MARALLALYFGLILLVREANAAQLTLPPVPHYELPGTPLPQPTTPPQYTEHDSSRQAATSHEHDEDDQPKSFWKPFIEDRVAFATLLLTGVTAILAGSIVGLWIVTGIAGKRQSREIRASTKVAEDAVAANLETLAHARETAERDFRPWLTLNARLISPVAVDPVPIPDNEEKATAFFIELQCRNVGKVAALNVIYSVSGIDIGYNEYADDWLQELIDASVHACKFAGPQSWRPKHSLESSSDALAPSEEYKAKRWCRIAPLKLDSFWGGTPKEQRVHRFCIGIVAAYSSVGSGPRDSAIRSHLSAFTRHSSADMGIAKIF